MRPFASLLLLFGSACGAAPGTETAQSAASADIHRASRPAESAAARSPCARRLTAPQLPVGAVEVLHAPHDGEWLAVCLRPGGHEPRLLRHAHHGESPADAQPMLVRADDEPHAVSRFVAVGPDGRWLVVARDGRLVLRDAQHREAYPLRPLHAQDDPVHYTVARHHPAASFDRYGKRLAYVRWGDAPGDAVAVVRRLGTGTEREVAPPRGHRLVGVRLDSGGAWLWLWSLPRERMARRSRLPGGPHRQCAAPASPDRRGGVPAPERGALTRHAVSLAELDTSAHTYLPRAAVAVGPDVLTHGDDGALRVRTPAGTVRELLDPGCDPRGLHVAPAGDAFAVLCQASGAIHLYQRGTAGLRHTVTYTPSAALAPPADEWRGSRWLRVGDRVVDLESGELTRVPPDAEVLAEAHGRLVYRTDGGALGVGTGSDTIGVPRIDHDTGGHWRATAGAFVLVGNGVVDVLTGRYGVPSGYPWALRASGHALVTTEEQTLTWAPLHFTERPCPCRDGSD